MAACGIRFQYTQLPNGSLSGSPSASTTVRLAPEPDRPRIVTPCVDGFATRDEERRNRLKPGVLRKASSTVPAAEFSNTAEVSTDVRSTACSGSTPREAVTVTVSPSGAGFSTRRTSVAGAEARVRASAKPGADARTSISPGGSASSVKRPSAPVVVSPARARPSTTTVAPGTGRPRRRGPRGDAAAAAGWSVSRRPRPRRPGARGPGSGRGRRQMPRTSAKSPRRTCGRWRMAFMGPPAERILPRVASMSRRSEV